VPIRTYSGMSELPATTTSWIDLWPHLHGWRQWVAYLHYAPETPFLSIDGVSPRLAESQTGMALWPAQPCPHRACASL